MKSKKKNSKFSFAVHADCNKGPNRVFYNPYEAIVFFKKLAHWKTKAPSPMITVTHLDSKLCFRTTEYRDLEIQQGRLFKNG